MNVIELLECESTNEELKKKIGSVEPGTLLWSQHQTKGKGQRSRTWVSVPGDFTGSIYFRLEASPYITQVSIRIGVEICLFLRKFIPNVFLKWPNDLMIKREDSLFKWGGILCESIQKNNIIHLVVGFGLNQIKKNESFEMPSISSEELGIKSVDCISLLQNVYQSFNTSDFSFRDHFEKVHLFQVGEEITVGTQKGVYLGLSSYGELILDQNGVRKKIQKNI
ncbi:MAG: biotin--[acetyl-CoA-carboxylase] ligase [Bdellovibrionaceae bacterium]|nr:biotin--[acetyl-CoA-carboxylase] ligase [Pseudobdellovibrionaceae bacterium]|tara:strand:+ start:2269 stop:2937 length:669 start_codon:yes stop_codon:yes gene_type:complete